MYPECFEISTKKTVKNTTSVWILPTNRQKEIDTFDRDKRIDAFNNKKLSTIQVVSILKTRSSRRHRIGTVPK